MDSQKKVRIQDDLYQYVNGPWIRKAVIPGDKPRVGGFADLDSEVEKILKKDFRSMKSGKKEIPSSYVGEALKLYKIARNVKRRNKDGIKPVEKDLEFVRSLKDIPSFNRKLSKLILEGYPLPFSLSVTENMRKPTEYCLMLGGPSLILPDTTYYQEAQKQSREALIGVYSSMVRKLLAYTGLPKEEQEAYLKDTLAFDEKLATVVKSQEEWSDYIACYEPKPLLSVTRKLAPVKFLRALKKIYGDKVPEEIMVAEPRYLDHFKELFTPETYPLYQHWAYVQLLTSSTAYLSEELREIGSVYGHTLQGIQKNVDIETQAYRLASRFFSEPIGLYYGETYFGEEAKKDITSIVHLIIKTYEKRIRENTFLAEQTKKKAILKLEKMTINMGYPDKVDKKYDLLRVSPRDSLYGAVGKLIATELSYSFGQLHEPVDRTIWPMPGHMVNACYNPSANSITFPAAILQAPFYSIKQSRSQNLGGIGAVIGHEISHAFDNNGAQCDETGAIHNWWTKHDYEEFRKKTQAMIEEFDGIEFHGGKVNGTLVVSENIADNGGMAVTLEIMDGMEEKDYKEYFKNWARVWCNKSREEFIRLLLTIDVHSPAELRANMQPRNFHQWYEAFNVKPTDKMYLAPEKRVVIW
jgi:putative endopeptidase